MKNTSILIVDDIPNWRDTLKRLISIYGYACETASSYEEAVDMLGKQLYKLAIIDLRLKNCDAHDLGGMEIVNWLSSTQSPTKAIIISGYATADSVRDLFGSSVVVGFFSKAGFAEPDFVARIEEVMKST